MRGFLGRRKATRAQAVAEKERQMMEAFLKKIQEAQVILQQQLQKMTENDAKIPNGYLHWLIFLTIGNSIPFYSEKIFFKIIGYFKVK